MRVCLRVKGKNCSKRMRAPESLFDEWINMEASLEINGDNCKLCERTKGEGELQLKSQGRVPQTS